MVEDLAESSTVGVSAVVLVIASGLVVHLMVQHCKNWDYPAAQKLCLVLFAMPMLIGWMSWVNLVTFAISRLVLYMISLYKSICIAAFVLYIDRLIGWVESGEKNSYSSAKVEEVLQAMRKADCFLKCLCSTSLQTPEQARKYRRRTRWCILQFPVTLILIGLIGTIIVFTDPEELSKDSFHPLPLALAICQSLSSIVAFNALINYAVFASKIPELAGLSVMRKFVLIKISMVLTELQPLVITIFATAGLIADTSEYSVSEISEYTNSLLLCSEMIVVGFLQVVVFPPTDYQKTPTYRKTLAAEIDGGFHAELKKAML